MSEKGHKTKDREKKKIKKVNREADYSSDIKMNTCEMATKNNMDCKYACTWQNRERYAQQMKRSDQSQRHQRDAASKKQGVRGFMNGLKKIHCLFSRQSMDFL